MKVTSAKKKPLSRKRNGVTGHKGNLEVLVKLERLPHVDELVKCETSRPDRIKIKEESSQESLTVKEEETSAAPSPSEAVVPKQEPDCESWAMQIKAEPESDYEISQLEEADLRKSVKREDDGDQDLKQEASEDAGSMDTGRTETEDVG